MKRLIVCLVVLMGLCRPVASMAAEAGSSATATASARERVDRGIREVLAAFRDPALKPEERHEKVVGLIDAGIDYQTLSRVAFGQQWKELTSAQQSEFVELFRTYMMNICRAGVRQYKDEELIILSDRAEARGDWTVLTRAIGYRPDGTRRDAAKVDFRLRNSNGQWNIIDVSVEGISLASAMRAQVMVIMKDGGIDRLLQLLREKNAPKQ